MADNKFSILSALENRHKFMCASIYCSGERRSS